MYYFTFLLVSTGMLALVQSVQNLFATKIGSRMLKSSLGEVARHMFAFDTRNAIPRLLPGGASLRI